MKTNVNITASHTAHRRDYSSWGMGKSGQQANQQPIDHPNSAVMEKASAFLPDTHWILNSAQLVAFDADSNEMNTILLRFTRDGKPNLLGEHISLVFNAKTLQLLGLTRMIKQDSKALPSHQLALQQALSFLQRESADLIQQADAIELPTCEPTQRIEFNPALSIDNIELQWIDQHPETIRVNGNEAEINGLKVKCYLPKINRWAWVIVDSQGDVITYERSIHWDFSQHRRLSPMWLHDTWLQHR